MHALKPYPSQRACRTNILRSRTPRYTYCMNALAATLLRNKHRHMIAQPLQHGPLPCFATEYAMLRCNCNDSVEQVGTRRSVLQRSHEARDGWPIRGSCDALADRRHRSSGSRAHHVAKEPPRSCPTCHRYPMLGGIRFLYGLHSDAYSNKVL
jgi:hypothetical protein